jgi:hypothetical protein
MEIDEEEHDALYHYGIRRRSGRYPWGSGETPHERAESFQGHLAAMRAQGLTDTEIAQGWGMTTTQLRATVTQAKLAKKAADISQARRLREAGNSNVAIGRIMNIGESSVRNLLKEGEAEKVEVLDTIMGTIQRHVDEKKFIDVGAGVEYSLGVSKERLKTAVGMLVNDDGYTLHYVQIPQLGTDKKTTLKVLAPPGMTYKEVYANRDKIQQIRSRSKDQGHSFEEILPPLSISSKRVHVRYAEDGGVDADGAIYVRPGVKDVSLGNSQYAQVRIAVDGTHYLKGMAIYNDENMPKGVDLVFNTNKTNTGNKLDAMKEMRRDKDGNVDKEDPFGSMISDQIKETGTFGEPKVSSVMNIVNKESDWDEWSKTLSSQMLSKQKPSLAQHQLDLTYESKKREFDTIMSLTNPTIKAHLLQKFADSADASAVHLKAAHLPRQATKVILPVNSLKPTEIYAPTFKNGERVVLVRFPHGHISEIPELVVNNRHAKAKKLLGNAVDAVGIHSSVAERLSGADFDGDTVLVIPNDLKKVRNKAPMQELIGFDPKTAYPKYDGMPIMDARQKGIEMGKISNLITDMTIQGAPDTEIARAVKHSMVVIDAEKHKLNYKLSAQENGIAALQEKYQPRASGQHGGASTIVSRATSETRVKARKLRPASEGGPIDHKTGRLVYVETGEEYSPGNPKTMKSTKLAETHDAHTLVSEANTPIERIYADHSNRLKALANEARIELVKTPNLEYSPSAAKVYSAQVKELDADLHLALSNAPHERQAQVVANAVYRVKKEANPDYDDAELKKVKSKALTSARIRVGAKKHKVKITDAQWEAIQAGAITQTKLKKILENTDVERVKELATPKNKKGMSDADISRAMNMLVDDRASRADVAAALGVSVSTLNAALRGEDTNE